MSFVSSTGPSVIAVSAAVALINSSRPLVAALFGTLALLVLVAQMHRLRVTSTAVYTCGQVVPRPRRVALGQIERLSAVGGPKNWFLFQWGVRLYLADGREVDLAETTCKSLAIATRWRFALEDELRMSGWLPIDSKEPEATVERDPRR